MSVPARPAARGALICLAISLGGRPVAAQQLAGEPTRERRGSFRVTAAAATSGALAGLAVANALGPAGSGGCPLVPGARCGDPSIGVLTAFGAMVVGSATGAVLGRRLTGGWQSVPRSLFGAALGLLVGGVVLMQLDTEAEVPVVLSFAVPQGIFAALIGW